MSGRHATGRGAAVRLGHLDFLNTYPVYLGLEVLAARGESLPPLRLVAGGGNPVALNRMLLAGRLDVSPSSSVLLAHYPCELETLGPAVASTGPVGSVLLASRVPAEALGGRAVALPPNSAASVALLRILARHAWRVAPRFVPWPGHPPEAGGPPDLPAVLAAADAALIIGDAALLARHHHPDLVWTDLGAAWFAWTGLPMVFSTWTARRAWVREHPALAAAVAETLSRALVAGRAALPGRIPELAARRGLPVERVEDYFYRCLDYSWNEAHHRGLDRFLVLAAGEDRAAGGSASAAQGVAARAVRG